MQLLLSIATAGSSSEILSDDNFDGLTVGTAPDNGVPAGPWSIDVSNPAEGLEDQPGQFTIVPTSSFDPSRAGNSLRVEWPRTLASSTQLHNVFDEPIPEEEGEIVRAKFDVFVPDMETSKRGGFGVYLGVDGSSNQSDRGPQVLWDSRGRITAYECGTVNCDSPRPRRQLDSSPLNAWQHVQLDIDLVSDTYDFFWADGNSDQPELIGAYIGFRSGTQDSLDRFAVALFSNAPSRPEGVAYLDNISIEVLEKIPGDANLDGQVNAADLNALALNWRSTGAGSWSQGDFTGDRNVDALDLNALALNWRSGVAPAASAAAVPEPSSITLLFLGVCALVRRAGRAMG